MQCSHKYLGSAPYCSRTQLVRALQWAAHSNKSVASWISCASSKRRALTPLRVHRSTLMARTHRSTLHTPPISASLSALACVWTREYSPIGHSVQVTHAVDRCHAFAAGYDIRTQETYEEMMRQFDEVIGLAALKAIHLNDSKTELVRH